MSPNLRDIFREKAFSSFFALLLGNPHPLQLPPKPPRKHQPVHAKISPKRPKRMAEGGGLVSFNEKVAEPSECIGGDWRTEQPPRVLHHDRDDHEQKDKTRPSKMPPPRRSFAVLGQIERPKLFIIAKLHLPFPLQRMRRAARECRERAAPSTRSCIETAQATATPTIALP